MRCFTTLILSCVCCIAFSQEASKKTYIISSNSSSPLLYNHITSLDIHGGKSLDDVFDPSKKYSLRHSEYKSYTKTDHEADEVQAPMGSSVACMAFDAKSNRLFYIPLQLSELRYMDLKEASPSFTYFTNQSINLLHNKGDVANQITRMTIGADGFGYALSNDGEHLIKFTTQGTPVIQDLGVLIDNPKNQVLVRSSCTSWGGDMVGCADGNLYLVTVHNHVFKISLPSKKCDFVGTIKHLPQEFTSNGASVDENGDLIVSCGTSLGKKFSPLYHVNLTTLEAEPVGDKIAGIGNISDMASSNLLFQKPAQTKETTVVAFTQTIGITENNLPVFTIFPNPVNRGRFQVKVANLKEKSGYKMILLDASGKAVMEEKMNLGTKINVNSFSFPARYAKGIYFIQIADVFNRTIYSQQLVVE